MEEDSGSPLSVRGYASFRAAPFALCRVDPGGQLLRAAWTGPASRRHIVSPGQVVEVVASIAGASPLGAGMATSGTALPISTGRTRWRRLDGSRQSEGDREPGEVPGRTGSACVPTACRSHRGPAANRPNSFPERAAVRHLRGGKPATRWYSPSRPSSTASQLRPSASERAFADISRRFPRSCTGRRTLSLNALRLCASNRKPVSPPRTMSTPPPPPDRGQRRPPRPRGRDREPAGRAENATRFPFPRRRGSSGPPLEYPSASGNLRATGKLPGPQEKRHRNPS